MCMGITQITILVHPPSTVRSSRAIKTVHLTENEVRNLCLKSRDIFLNQPILLELEAPIKICGKRARLYCTSYVPLYSGHCWDLRGFLVMKVNNQVLVLDQKEFPLEVSVKLCTKYLVLWSIQKVFRKCI